MKSERKQFNEQNLKRVNLKFYYERYTQIFRQFKSEN